MRQLREHPSAAIAGEWFTGRAAAHDKGWFGDERNAALAAELRRVFAQRTDDGRNDFSDRNTIIPRPELTSGVLMSHGTRHDIADFASQQNQASRAAIIGLREALPYSAFGSVSFTVVPEPSALDIVTVPP